MCRNHVWSSLRSDLGCPSDEDIPFHEIGHGLHSAGVQLHISVLVMQIKKEKLRVKKKKDREALHNVHALLYISCSA